MDIAAGFRALGGVCVGDEIAGADALNDDDSGEIDPRAILNGFRAIGGAQPAPTFPGDLRRSKAKTAFMTGRKKRLCGGRRGEDVKVSHNSLADAWDKTVLRQGDTAKRFRLDGETLAQTRHPNYICPNAVIRSGFLAVGAAGLARSLQGGVGGAGGHSHEMLCAVARICQLAEENATLRKADRRLDSKASEAP